MIDPITMAIVGACLATRSTFLPNLFPSFGTIEKVKEIIEKGKEATEEGKEIADKGKEEKVQEEKVQEEKVQEITEEEKALPPTKRKRASSTKRKTSGSTKRKAEPVDVMTTQLKDLKDGLTVGDLVALVQEGMKANMEKMAEQVSDNLDVIYTQQLAMVQDFINGDSTVSVSSVRDLMRMLLPAKYNEAISNLKRGQSVSTIINNIGGYNVNAPQAETVVQKAEK